MGEHRDLRPRVGALTTRERFGSRFGLVATMIGVAVGLGNVWRFPYMVGRFGGAAFVLFYVVVVVAVGVPALMAEWILGRRTQRGPVGAFARARLPLGRPLGWLFFAVIVAATGYYTNVLGWVVLHAVAEVAGAAGAMWSPAAVLPPASGFDGTSLILQLGLTATLLLACAGVSLRGLKAGIEPVSRLIMPVLLATLVILIVRGLTLPGAGAGLAWYLLKFDIGDLTPRVMVAAMGQAIFSLSLGGTFMVVYGSYLARDADLRGNAAWTAVGDAGAGLLAGLAIFPAMFALGLEPESGPGLLFTTLPGVFAAMPAGWFFGTLFFGGLAGAGFLSAIAAIEVAIAGLVDNTRLGRRGAVWTVAGLAFLLAIPPMINMAVFVPWDLTFGSGAQTVGVLLSVVAVGWALDRASVLEELAAGSGRPPSPLLYGWLRYVIPAAIVTVGTWWFLTDVLGVASGV